MHVSTDEGKQTATVDQREANDFSAVPSKEDTSTPFRRTTRGIVWALIVPAITSSVFLSALDNTVVANVIPSITVSLGHPELIPWISIGAMMGGMSVALPFGKLFGLYNVKWLYVTSLVVFMAGSAMCGAAPNMNTLIVGRVIAGVAGSGMYLGVLTLMSVNTEERERPTYLALVGLVFGVGTCVGPLIGGALAESPVHWRFAFYLNLVVSGVFIPVNLFMLPTYDPCPGVSLAQRSCEIDYLGTTLSIGAVAFTVIGVDFGGITHSWGSATVITMLALGFACWIAFFTQQSYTLFTKTDQRVFPMVFLGRLEHVLLFLLTAIPEIATFAGIYYIPLYFQFVKGMSPITSATRALPLVVLISFTILLNGAALSKFRNYKPWYIIGTAITVAGGVLLSRIDVDTPDGYIYGAQIILAIGVGCHVQSGFAVVQTITEPIFLAYAITFMMFAQLLGITIGLSITGTIFINTAISRLSATLPTLPHRDILDLISGVRSNLLQDLTYDEQTHAIVALAGAIRNVFIFAYAVAALGFILSWFLKRK